MQLIPFPLGNFFKLGKLPVKYKLNNAFCSQFDSSRLTDCLWREHCCFFKLKHKKPKKSQTNCATLIIWLILGVSSSNSGDFAWISQTNLVYCLEETVGAVSEHMKSDFLQSRLPRTQEVFSSGVSYIQNNTVKQFAECFWTCSWENQS